MEDRAMASQYQEMIVGCGGVLQPLMGRKITQVRQIIVSRDDHTSSIYLSILDVLPTSSLLMELL